MGLGERDAQVLWHGGGDSVEVQAGVDRCSFQSASFFMKFSACSSKYLCGIVSSWTRVMHSLGEVIILGY